MPNRKQQKNKVRDWLVNVVVHLAAKEKDGVGGKNKNQKRVNIVIKFIG